MMKNYDQPVKINYNPNWPYFLTIFIESQLLVAQYQEKLMCY